MTHDAMSDHRTATYIKRLGIANNDIASTLGTVLGFHEVRELLCACAIGGQKAESFLRHALGTKADEILAHLRSPHGHEAIERTEIEVRLSSIPADMGGKRHVNVRRLMSLLSPPPMPDGRAIENAMNFKFPKLSPEALCRAAMLRFHGVHPAYDEAIQWMDGLVGATRLAVLDRWCVVTQEKIAEDGDDC